MDIGSEDGWLIGLIGVGIAVAIVTAVVWLMAARTRSRDYEHALEVAEGSEYHFTNDFSGPGTASNDERTKGSEDDDWDELIFR